jgi:hypothetical protein
MTSCPCSPLSPGCTPQRRLPAGFPMRVAHRLCWAHQGWPTSVRQVWSSVVQHSRALCCEPAPAPEHGSCATRHGRPRPSCSCSAAQGMEVSPGTAQARALSCGREHVP